MFSEFRDDREASTSKALAQLSSSFYELRKKTARDFAILQEGMLKFVQEFFKHTNPRLRTALFIAQTGWGKSEHRQLSKETGFHHHLVKPVDLETLEKTLAEYSPENILR